MAVQTITYGDKSYLNENANIPATNKVQDTDMNEIKSVVNNNANELTNIMGKILWTNPNPTSDFSAQTITLSSNDYDVLEFVFELGTTGTSSTMTKILKGTNGNVDQIVNLNSGASQSTGVRHRTFKYSSDTSYIFEDCLVREGGTASVPSVANNYLIPIYVIGYKTGLFD